MELRPSGLGKSDTVEDACRRADMLSAPDGSRHSGMLCDNKDLRRIVLLARELRNTRADEERIRREAREAFIDLLETKAEHENRVAMECKRSPDLGYDPKCHTACSLAYKGLIPQVRALAEPRPESRSVVLDANCARAFARPPRPEVSDG